jgi:hypothetical protein
MVLMAVYAYPNLTRNASVSNLQDLLQVLICILLEPDVHQVNLIRIKLVNQVATMWPLCIIFLLCIKCLANKILQYNTMAKVNVVMLKSLKAVIEN